MTVPSNGSTIQVGEEQTSAPEVIIKYVPVKTLEDKIQEALMPDAPSKDKRMLREFRFRLRMKLMSEARQAG